MIRIFITVLLAIHVPLLIQADDFETVTIVCENDFAPYGYRSKTGEAAGFSTDVIVAAYRSVGVKVQFEVMPYARCMYLTKKGVKIGCYNTNNDAINLRDHYFPEQPLFKGEMVLWARSDYHGTMSVAELAASGAMVGVTHGYNYDDPDVDFDYNDKIIKNEAKSVILTLKKLVAGRYNFAAAEKKVALLAIAHHRDELEGKVKIVGTISEPGLYLSFSKTNSDGKRFCDLLSQGIENIKQSGEYRELVTKWNHLVNSGNIP